MAQVEVTSHVEVFLDHDVVLDSGMVFPPKAEDGSPWLPAVVLLGFLSTPSRLSFGPHQLCSIGSLRVP